jgi:hypothetical protein
LRRVRLTHVLKSVIEVYPDALSMPLYLDVEQEHGKFRNGLHGIPLLVKNDRALVAS